MRNIIIDLIKLYSELNPVIKRTIIHQTRQGATTITREIIRASQIWEVTDKNTGMYDESQTRNILDNSKQSIANRLYDLAIDYLNNKNEYKEYKSKYDPRVIEGSDQKVSFAIRVFLHYDIITFYDVEVVEPTFDEEARLLGFKKLSDEKLKSGDIDQDIGDINTE